MTETVTVVLGAVAVLLAVRHAQGGGVLALAAVAVGAGALLGPLDPLAERSLAAHMLQHVLVGDLAPLLLVLALARGDVRRLPAAWPLRRALERLCRPLPAFALWAAALGVWHVPALYDAALGHAPLHALEHGSFALGGALVWAQLLDPARRGLLGGWRRFGYALGLLACAQMLANVLVLSYRPLYGAYAGADRPLGLSAVGDQDAAALVMMAEQLLTLGTFAFLVARRLVARTPDRADAAHPLAA